MSTSIAVYARKRPNIREALKGLGFSKANIIETDQYLIEVYDPEELEQEDVPAELAFHAEGLRFRVILGIEPSGAPDAAYEKLILAGKRIAHSSKGIVEDGGLLHIGDKTITLPRPTPLSKDKDIAVVSWSWWINHDPLATPELRESFYQILKSDLPEAIPRRYGTTETPEHKFSENNRKHFLKFIHEFSNVCFTKHPVVDFSVSVPNIIGRDNSGFRFSQVRIGIDSTADNSLDAHLHFKNVCLKISRFLNPFYGDIRILSGYSFNGKNLENGSDYFKMQHHPISSWWFRGIPSHFGQALVLGGEYSDAWWFFNKRAQSIDQLRYVYVLDQPLIRDVRSKLFWVPRRLRAPDGAQIHHEAYAKFYPFSTGTPRSDL